jgi:hypothetical protein
MAMDSQGISSLASGVGPMAFAALFAAFSMPERTGLPYAPQVRFICAALVMFTGSQF